MVLITIQIKAGANYLLVLHIYLTIQMTSHTALFNHLTQIVKATLTTVTETHYLHNQIMSSEVRCTPLFF